MSRPEWATAIADAWRALGPDRPSTSGKLAPGVDYRLAYGSERLSLTQPIFLAGTGLTLRILAANRLVVAYTLPGSIHFAHEVEAFALAAIHEATKRIDYMRLMVKRWDAEQDKEVSV